MKKKQSAPLDNKSNCNHEEIHEIIEAVKPLTISQKKSIMNEINVLKRTKRKV